MFDLCIYHKNCADGFAAATVVLDRFKDEGSIEFIAAQYGSLVPDVNGRRVIIVDFSYPRKVLLGIKEKAKDLLVIDHHASAEKELSDLDFCIFDQSKCGAILTWEYLYPNVDVPLFLKYIQDRDLWTRSLPNNKAVTAAIRSYGYNFDQWSIFLDKKDERDMEGIIMDGLSILRYQERCLEMALNNGFQLVDIAGHKVPCMNVTDGFMISEICGKLAEIKGASFAATYFDTNDGQRIFSLRSRGENGVDVSEIAKKYGGGGHKNAAGFKVEIGMIDKV